MNAEDKQTASPAKKSSPFSTIALIAFAIVAGILVQESTSMPESAVNWGKDLKVALAASGAESKPILLNFTSRGCQYCVQMEKEVIVQDDIKSTIEKYIPVKLDAFDNKEASARYDIYALPAYVIVDANDKKLDMVDGVQPAGRFKEFLDKGLVIAQTKTQ